MKIFVAGHLGMVGSALVRKLKSLEHSNVIVTRTRDELDLTDQLAVRMFFQEERPDQVYLAAAKVGGIMANNTYPADFIYQNLIIEANVISSAHGCGVKKLLFLGSSCIYPKAAPQPMTEDALLTSGLEPTNEPYAIAKIAGIKLCESYNRQYGTDYRSVMPSNLYGPGDNYHRENSHVIPGLIRRFHEAKNSNLDSVTVWGSGKPRREFLHVDDMADAAVHVMNLDEGLYRSYTSSMSSHINVGSGVDISIGELALLIAQVVGFNGKILFDKSKPDGPPKKLMDVNRINALGWRSTISLGDGLSETYRDFLEHRNRY